MRRVPRRRRPAWASFPSDTAAALKPRLRAAHAANDCRACWYASRAEVESLYTLRGFLGGLRTLVTGVKRPGALLLAALLLSSGAAGQTPPPGGDKGAAADVTDLVNSLLGGLLGGGDVTGERLQEEVAEAGGLPFRENVPVAFLGREELGAYLRELFDAEYPVALARADERLLQAFDLLPPGTDLRALRARVLEENVAGFYDERPGKRRLYAVSEDRSFSPMNQIVLVHELRHAQQDQYERLDGFLGDDVSDFDDRRLAWTSLLEGDATLVMERFVRLRLGSLGGAAEAPAAGDPAALGTPGLFDVPGAPPVVRDQLVQPYLAGLTFARALWARGGGEALREAWGRPPRVHRAGPAPREVLLAGEAARRGAGRGGAAAAPGCCPRACSARCCSGRWSRTRARPPTEGWGGDGWRLWDVGGRTALAWRSEWDGAGRRRGVPRRAAGALRAVRRSCLACGLGGLHARRAGARFAMRRAGEAVDLVSADDGALFDRMVGG